MLSTGSLARSELGLPYPPHGSLLASIPSKLRYHYAPSKRARSDNHGTSETSARLFCGSFAPLAVGTSGDVAPAPTIAMACDGTLLAISAVRSAEARARDSASLLRSAASVWATMRTSLAPVLLNCYAIPSTNGWANCPKVDFS